MAAPIAPPATDPTPPSVPTNLTATVLNATQINLGWTASTDNVAVTGYRVERCQGVGCNNFAQVGAPAGAGFSDTGLAPGTSYSYRVRAADAAGNFSAYSNIASGTTPSAPDTTAPTAPTGLNATPRDQSDQPELVGLDRQRRRHRLPRRALPGHELQELRRDRRPRRDGLQQHRPHRRRRYRYRVRATDAAGNLSPIRHRHGTTPAPDTAPPSARPGASAARVQSDQPGLDGLDRQRRGHGLPRRALPGRGLHELRTGRRADGHRLQRHRPEPRRPPTVSGAGLRRGRQPQRLFGDRPARRRPRTRRRRRRRPGWTRPRPVDPDRPELDGVDRQRRRHRLPDRALPGRELHAASPRSPRDHRVVLQHRAHREHDLPLPGPGGRRRRQPERVLEHRVGDHAVADTTNPGAPTRPAATPPARTRIDLAWTASTDNVGVTGYRVERCQGAGCTNYAEVAQPTGTTSATPAVTPSTLPLPRSRERRGRQPQHLLVRRSTRPRRRCRTPRRRPSRRR